jgi:hypothetical protein
LKFNVLNSRFEVKTKAGIAAKGAKKAKRE